MVLMVDMHRTYSLQPTLPRQGPCRRAGGEIEKWNQENNRVMEEIARWCISTKSGIPQYTCAFKLITLKLLRLCDVISTL